MNIINFIDERVYELISRLTSATMTTIMMLISHFGSAIVLIILTISAFILIKKRKYPIFILINLVSTFIINRLLKVVFRRDRPALMQIINESGYSFPSGHAMVSISFYGLLIYFAYKNIKNRKIKNLIISLLSVLVIAIGISLIIFIKYIVKRKED